jgi:hypothetical protein
MFKRRDGGEGSKGLEKMASVEGEVEDGENEDELEDEEGNVGVNGDRIMDESENLAIPTSGMIRREEANTDNHAGPSGLPANPTDDPDDPDGMAIDRDDLNMYEDCPPGDSAINGPPERPTPQIVPPRKNNSPAPFSFCGGAPCIIPKQQASTTTYPHSHNILSLNSDDGDPTLHKHPKMTMPHNLRPTVSARESDPESAKMRGYHSRSSSCHTPASEESGDSSSNFTGVTSQSQAGNSSRSRKWVRETPADKITN